MTTAPTTPVQQESPAPPEQGEAEPRPARHVQPPSSAYETVIERTRGSIPARIREAFRWRDLLFMLVQRDVKVRYRQTAFGIIWAVAVPALTLAVYWVVFGMLGRMGPEGMPYPLFLFPALIVWNYFHSATGRAANSLKHDAPILSKVYFPRLLLPLANITSPIVDFAFGFLVMLVILAIYRYPPGWQLVFVPAFLLLAMVAASGMGMGLAVLNAHYRDVFHFLPVMLQLWFFCSPALYGTDLVPERFQLLYALNPMVTACEGVRACALGEPFAFSPMMAIVSCLSALAMLLGGMLTFMRFEQTVTDVL